MFQENSIETCILSRVKQITSPGWMHETSAWTWCTGKTQRDWVEREVGGGIGWGIHVYPWLIHVNVWQKPLQYCKVISLQLIKKKIKIKCVSFIFLKKQFLVFLIFSVIFLLSISFISALIFVIYILLLNLSLVCSFSSFLSCRVRLIIWDLTFS